MWRSGSSGRRPLSPGIGLAGSRGMDSGGKRPAPTTTAGDTGADDDDDVTDGEWELGDTRDVGCDDARDVTVCDVVCDVVVTAVVTSWCDEGVRDRGGDDDADDDDTGTGSGDRRMTPAALAGECGLCWRWW